MTTQMTVRYHLNNPHYNGRDTDTAHFSMAWIDRGLLAIENNALFNANGAPDLSHLLPHYRGLWWSIEAERVVEAS